MQIKDLFENTKIAIKRRLPSTLKKWHARKIHKRNKEWIKSLIPDSLHYLSNQNNEFEKRAIQPDTPIFVMWWQGKNNLPPIVQVCQKKLQTYSGTHPIVFITEENIEQVFIVYTGKQIDLEIMGWLRSGKITIAYFSDFVRSALLSSQSGGIWVDATLLFTKPIDETILNKSFYSLKRYKKGEYWRNVPELKWSAYFLVSAPYNPFMGFLNMALKEAVKRNGEIPHYFTVDYIMAIAYDLNPYIHAFIENLPSIDPNVFLLQDINAIVSKDDFQGIYDSSPVFKMNWRIVPEKEKESSKTIYKFLVEK